jgi:hypothetical protein
MNTLCSVCFKLMPYQFCVFLVSSGFTVLFLLCRVLNKKQSDIKRSLERYRVLEISNGAPVVNKPRNQRYLLSSIEVGVVVLGCVVFVGALAAAICVGCVRRGKRR